MARSYQHKCFYIPENAIDPAASRSAVAEKRPAG
jgi:hypothetical protein